MGDYRSSAMNGNWKWMQEKAVEYPGVSLRELRKIRKNEGVGNNSYHTTPG
jgi:hypothetical protein